MNNGFYYQMLVGLSQANGQFNLPRVLKDVVKAGAFEDVKSVEDAVVKEAAECSLVEANGGEYFTSMASNALLFAMFRSDFDRFNEIAEMMAKRLETAGTVGAGIATETWGKYLSFLKSSARRLTRVSNVEEFEQDLDDIEWGIFDKSFTSRICMVVGLVYQNEKTAERIGKARFWLQKAINDSDFSGGLAATSLMADYLLSEGSPESLRKLEELIRSVTDGLKKEGDKSLERLYKTLQSDLQVRLVIANAIIGAEVYEDDQIKLEDNLGYVREASTKVQKEGNAASSVFQGFLKFRLATCYADLSQGDIDPDDVKELRTLAAKDFSEAIEQAKKANDTRLAEVSRTKLLAIQVRIGGKNVEKDLKDALAEARKSNDMVALLEYSQIGAAYYLGMKYGSQKAYEVLVDTLRRGQKRLDDGGFYLVVNAMGAINKIMVEQVERPGTSWVVTELEGYFNTIAEIVDSLDSRLQVIGQDAFAEFQEYFYLLEPATHHNIKTYLRYQFNEIKVLRLSSAMREDDNAVKIADRLLAELSAENNPLTFIRAAWDEFKDVPNSVRNKVVNKCISITKGDLPAAAEHLDFSYRNLRSYITFQEVNRLGFFLDEQQTSNKQLEQGIRLLFHDLYKNGTIFEVVFDMPKFLVEHAKSGFSSQDLELALDIKGTTAKKYIKIMMDIGLVKLERSIGRKHFYKLRKDNVMTRLGKEQKVIGA